MTELVKVDLVSTVFDKSVGEEVKKWWNGKISGERCAKTIVDKAGDALPVAGVLGGMFGGGAAGAVGGPIGAVFGALFGAVGGGLGGQALNCIIKMLRYVYVCGDTTLDLSFL